MAGEIPPSLRVFLEKHIHSIWILELLLFLWKNSSTSWDAQRLNLQLHGTLSSTQACLDEFVSKKILCKDKSASTPQYRFNASNARLQDTLKILSQYYAEYRNKVIDCIYSPQGTLSTFADAFILRKEKKDG